VRISDVGFRGTYNVNDVVRQLTGVVCGQIVASGLDQENLGVELLVQVLECVEVLRDVLTDLFASVS